MKPILFALACALPITSARGHWLEPVFRNPTVGRTRTLRQNSEAANWKPLLTRFDLEGQAKINAATESLDQALGPVRNQTERWLRQELRGNLKTLAYNYLGNGDHVDVVAHRLASVLVALVFSVSQRHDLDQRQSGQLAAVVDVIREHLQNQPQLPRSLVYVSLRQHLRWRSVWWSLKYRDRSFRRGDSRWAKRTLTMIRERVKDDSCGTGFTR